MSSSSDNKSLFSFAGTAVPGEAATASSAGDDDVVNYEDRRHAGAVGERTAGRTAAAAAAAE